jgi:SOS-response transcriptional repressor LexA
MSTTASAPLTDRQAQLLLWIGCHLAEQRYGPTVREIGQAHGLTSSGVHCHLRALKAKGCITWVPGQARSISITGGEA